MVFKSVLDINNNMETKEFIKLGIGLIILASFLAIMLYYGGSLY